jgi:hypothetical protein
LRDAPNGKDIALHRLACLRLQVGLRPFCSRPRLDGAAPCMDTCVHRIGFVPRAAPSGLGALRLDMACRHCDLDTVSQTLPCYDMGRHFNNAPLSGKKDAGAFGALRCEQAGHEIACRRCACRPCAGHGSCTGPCPVLQSRRIQARQLEASTGGGPPPCSGGGGGGFQTDFVEGAADAAGAAGHGFPRAQLSAPVPPCAAFAPRVSRVDTLSNFLTCPFFPSCSESFCLCLPQSACRKCYHSASAIMATASMPPNQLCRHRDCCGSSGGLGWDLGNACPQC